MKRFVYIVNKSQFKLPEYKTKGSAGIDIRANLTDEFIAKSKKEGVIADFIGDIIEIDGIRIPANKITLKPLQRILIPTGLYIQLDEDCELQMRPRSGNAIKLGLTLLNTPGTIDSDYRDEVGIIAINLGYEDITITNGDRIAQCILSTFIQVEWKEVNNIDELSITGRKGGFGHTGIK